MSKFKVAIIGGGIAGLSAGFFIRKKYGDKVDFTIFEKENRLGGTIGITRENGFTIDWGPNGFLDKEPLTLALAKDVGISDKLYPSDRKSEKRFIYRNNKLWEINPNPKKFMKSGLLSLAGRLRIVFEYFVGAKKNDSEESIYDFAARRIGKEAADILIDPMVSGIYGGDAQKLELGACFPVMEQMEKQYGGLIRAMVKRRKASKASTSEGGPAGPSGHLTSFKGGLYTLIERLESLLKDNLRYPDEIKSIEKTNDGKFKISQDGSEVIYDAVILGTPSYVTANILKPVSAELAELLNEIPYSSLAVVCQGYKLENVGCDLDGFGFLIPHNQNKNILGSIWTSVIFPEQAPEGMALFRTMLGGAKNESIVNIGEKKLSEITHEELTPILNLKAEPDYEKIIIWDKAIPQYILGHRRRLAKINSILDGIGNVYLAGNAYTGISLNDTIKRSHNIVQELIKD